MRKKLLLVFVSLAALAGIFGFWSTSSFRELRGLALGSDRVFLSRDGKVLEVVRSDFKKRRLGWYPLSEFSPTLVHAIMEAEDRRFRSHLGVDFVGLTRAAYAIARGRHVQGASTLTMQLTDMIQPRVLLDNRPITKGSLVHKAVQIWRALWLETRWSKDEILEAYLNLIHLRGEYQGFPALSLGYFGKSPLLLSLEESAAAAAMIASPNLKTATLQNKSCALLHKLAGKPEACEGVTAVVARILSRPPALPPAPDLAPHLARRLMQNRPASAIVGTFVDRDLQRAVQEILQRHILHLKVKNVNDSAAIVIDNASGEVLAYVGSVPSSLSPYVDGVSALRQAGSSLKPFLYARGFDQRLITPASILLDEGTAISWAGGVYRPTNYDRQFNGPVSVREALASSLNVPAVKTLITIGLANGYETLQKLHFSNLREPDFYGVSMALGAVDIKLEDLANAHRTLANQGDWSPLRFVAQDPNAKENVFSPEASFLVTNILSDPNARAIGFGWESPLETSFWTEVKTGTSKDYRDNWCVGSSDRYTVGVWDGNFNSEAMKEVSGVSGAAPSWYDIMNYLHHDRTSKAPPVPAGIVEKRVRHEWVSHEHAEYFISGTEPSEEVVQLAVDKRAQFIFPAEGSILVKDPRLDPKYIAVFVRFKGQVPRDAQLRLDQTLLGPAVSPFRIDDIAVGKHQLALQNPHGELLTAINFTVKGGQPLH